jgi:DnaJ-class molecular chaperone
MNLLDSVEILELPQNYNQLDIKQNYKRLIMKYHPDKNNGSSEQFIKIQNAYEFINKEQNGPSFESIDNLIKKFVHSFSIDVPIFKNKNQNSPKVPITIKEYFTGTTKKIKTSCNCKRILCINCAGSGYNILKKPMDVCMECMGDGYISNCNCTIDIKLPKFPKENQIILSDDDYFFHSGKLCYNFKISLKESLIGFKKTFKDPFDINHFVIVNQIVKHGDGYNVVINGIDVILIFVIDYPKKLNGIVKKLLIKTIDF